MGGSGSPNLTDNFSKKYRKIAPAIIINIPIIISFPVISECKYLKGKILFKLPTKNPVKAAIVKE